jgi:uncharacterized protein
MNGTTVERDGGACYIVPDSFDEAYQHGLHGLLGLRHVSGERLSLICRDEQLAYFDATQAVFLDTETTGLGMGVGTYVFLVGVGYLDGDHFRIQQFFLRGPNEERAFLDELGDFLAQFTAIVTFNGKAFDWPLLENRYVLHRRRPPLTDPLHVDLLHPARRMWKRRLESCALSSLESRILGVHRSQSDVPGYLIPHLYFQYQTTGDGRPLQGVFYHNLQDILSLAGLTIHMHHVLVNPDCGLVRDAIDFASLGIAFERAGDPEPAMHCYEEALRRGLHHDDQQYFLMRLACVQKRERRWESIHSTWYQLLDSGGRGALLARVELAKYYEHVERDYLQAIDHVQQALSLMELYGGDWLEVGERDLRHRLSRLVKRAMRSRSWVG